MNTIQMSDWVGSWEELMNDKKLPVRISEELYDEFLGVLPPQEFGKTRADFINLPIPVQEYFLTGEAQTYKDGKPVFATFARAFDDKYFFIGYLPSTKQELNR